MMINNKAKAFIEKAICKHNNKFDYSKVLYVNSITKVEVICKEHGSFFVRPDAHVRKVGCPQCNGGIKYTKEKWIQKAELKHENKFDYSKVVYSGSTKKVEVICKEHGSFFISPINHLAGQKCSKCSGVYRKSTNDFIKEANLTHSHLYDYCKANYINNRIKVQIICKKHGLFFQNPKDHLNGHGCKYCNISKGEKIVQQFLEENSIEFKKEYRFKGCVGINGGVLPFDFYIPSMNILIEYDGIQHFKPVSIFGGEEIFIQQQKNDQLRNEWSLINDLNLVRIKYNSVKRDLTELSKLLGLN